MGAAGFGSGQFNRPVYNRFIREIEAQRILMEEFREVATENMIKALDLKVSPQSLAELERMRKIALASPESNSLDGITGQQWFAASTAVINRLKDVEDVAAKESLKAADDKVGELWTLLVWELVIGVALLAMTVLLAMYMARSISHPFQRLNEAMVRMSQGQLDINVDDAQRKDEFGEMMKSVVVFRDAALDKQRLENEAKEQQRVVEEERRRNEEAAARAVETIGDALGKLAGGDLTARVTAELSDQYGELKENFNISAAKLEEAFDAVAKGREQHLFRHQRNRASFGRSFATYGKPGGNPGGNRSFRRGNHQQHCPVGIGCRQSKGSRVDFEAGRREGRRGRAARRPGHGRHRKVVG